jgi:hypothetical protein
MVTDIEEARRLPLVNLPTDARRIRIRQLWHARGPVKFFIRVSDGIETFFGTEKNGSIELMRCGNGRAHTRKP